MNWQTLFLDILAAGKTQAEIAARLGISQPTVSEYASGKLTTPSWPVGDALLKMHAEVVGSAADQVAAE
ncbi:MAG TPA: helix-turn-helix transcriptional regulator [Denitromonas sp.]|nr:helix-turn-helix domain-containing protein [Zoogloeaceae bacterium]HQU89222.1 helix-turn-helix transcriptional regulator [Denitromonas sp.]HQV14536.1 helix-turn-helix transcriptional regulator [Denitromonas sp.]